MHMCRCHLVVALQSLAVSGDDTGMMAYRSVGVQTIPLAVDMQVQTHHGNMVQTAFQTDDVSVLMLTQYTQTLSEWRWQCDNSGQADDLCVMTPQCHYETLQWPCGSYDDCYGDDCSGCDDDVAHCWLLFHSVHSYHCHADVWGCHRNGNGDMVKAVEAI